MSDKPIKAKPQFYAYCFEGLLQVARDLGYNLLIHGSMGRDMDLVAIPWVDKPCSHYELLDAFCVYLGAGKMRNPAGDPEYMYKKLPGGRDTYVINLNRGGKFNGYVDKEYYLDISITPLVVSD